jgi:V/A-type H+-transporting ATPase subunit D
MRAKLLELRQTLAGAQAGREVLERKRELILGELRRRSASAAQHRARLAAKLAEARALVASARADLGTAPLEAALLAQPPAVTVERRSAMLLGVRIPKIVLLAPPFRAAYGPGGTRESLDRAGSAFAALLPDVGLLADDEAAAAALHRALLSTARLLGAVDEIVIPGLRRQIHEVTAEIEEEDRDEHLRRNRWLASRVAFARSP